MKFSIIIQKYYCIFHSLPEMIAKARERLNHSVDMVKAYVNGKGPRYQFDAILHTTDKSADTEIKEEDISTTENNETDRDRLQSMNEVTSRASSVEVPSPVGVRRSSGFTAYTFEDIRKNAHETPLLTENPRLLAPNDSHCHDLVENERDIYEEIACACGKLVFVYFLCQTDQQIPLN